MPSALLTSYQDPRAVASGAAPQQTLLQRLPLVLRLTAKALLLLTVGVRIPFAYVSILLLPRSLSFNQARRGFAPLGLGTVNPHPGWSAHKAFLVRLIQHFIWIEKTTEVGGDSRDDFTRLPHSKKGDVARAVWVQPIMRSGGDALKGPVGDLFKAGGCITTRFPGWWYGEKRDGPYTASKGEKVVIHFHGGGYRDGSGSPNSHVMLLTKNLLKALNSGPSLRDDSLPHRVFAPSYRLTTQGAITFPDILADAVATWKYLVVELGFEPSNVYLMGDSAGGNLALALTRYLRDEKPYEDIGKGGLPAGLILYSPWIDTAASHSLSSPNSSGQQFQKYDILTVKTSRGAGDRLVRGLPVDTRHSQWLSPVNVNRSVEKDLFQGFPRTICFAGSLESFADEIRSFVHHFSSGTVNMPPPIPGKGRDANAPVVKRSADGKLTYLERPLSFHDYGAVPFVDLDEKREDADIVKRWLKDGTAK